MELPAPAAGTITEILAEEGETVTVGQVIARMRAGAGAPPASGGTVRRAGGPQRAADDGGNGAPRRSPDDAKDLARRRAASPPPRASTSARVQGSGPGGRITKADVLAARATAATAPRATGGSRRRRRPSPRAPPLLKGGAAMLARYMDESPLDPDRDLVPHDDRHGHGRAAARSSRPPARRSPSRT